MELELNVLEMRGNLNDGGAAELELVALGGAPPMNEVEIAITIILLGLTGILFLNSVTGRVLMDWIDNLGNATQARVMDGGGGGAQFTLENRLEGR